MKIVQVTYTTRREYSAKNMANIKTVMNDLQQLHQPGIRYTAILGSDGKTFTHTAYFQSEADQKILFELSSFKNFQEQLKSSIPEVPPKQEILTLVGSSNNIFNI